MQAKPNTLQHETISALPSKTHQAVPAFPHAADVASFQTLNHIHSDQYYVKMAQAWLIAEMFTKHRDVTLQFLQKNNLSNWVQNKAIQKARESYRVSEVDKTMLSKLKR